MCSTPKMPETDTTPQQEIAVPTQADARVSKTTTNTRNKSASLAGRNIRTSARGLAGNPQTDKKSLLGE